MSSGKWKPVAKLSAYAVLIAVISVALWRWESALSEKPNPGLQKDYQLTAYLESMKEEDSSAEVVDSFRKIPTGRHPMKLKYSPSADQMKKALGQPDEYLKSGSLVWTGQNVRLQADSCVTGSGICTLIMRTVLQRRGFLESDDYEEETVSLEGAFWKHERVTH